MTTKKVVAVKSGSIGAVAKATGPAAPSVAVGSSQSTTASGTAPQVPTGKPVSGFREKLQQLLAGVNVMLPEGTSATSVGNAPLSKSERVAQLTQSLGTYAAVDSDEHSLALSRQELEAELPSMKAFYTQCKDALVMFYGKGSPSLSQFGTQSKGSRKPLTPTQVIEKTARANQTRAIRHTVGKVEKATQKFVGTVAISTEVNGPNAEPSGPAAGSTPVAPTPPVTPGA